MWSLACRPMRMSDGEPDNVGDSGQEIAQEISRVGEVPTDQEEIDCNWWLSCSHMDGYSPERGPTEGTQESRESFTLDFLDNLSDMECLRSFAMSIASRRACMHG